MANFIGCSHLLKAPFDLYDFSGMTIYRIGPQRTSAAYG